MKTFRTTRPLLTAALAATLTLGACSGAGAPAESASPPPTAGPSSSPLTDPVGGGGGSTGNVGAGILPVDPGIVDPGVIDPGAGQAKLVAPKAGQLDPHPVVVNSLQTSIDGRHVLVKASWYSGIEPCDVLDSVRIERTGTTIAITLLEGTGDRNAICIELAVLKATIIDLGELEPGTWTILSPNGEAKPIEITIT